MRRLKSRRLPTVFQPLLHVLRVKPLNDPDEIVSLVPDYAVSLAVVEDAADGDRPNSEGNVAGGPQLLEGVVVKLQTLPQLWSIRDCIGQWLAKPDTLIDDLRFYRALLPSVAEDRPEFPRSASKRSSRKIASVVDCSFKSV